MAGEHLTAPLGEYVKGKFKGPLAEATFSFTQNGKEIFHITPEGVVIVQGDVYEAAKLFWDMVQELAPPGWKVEKE